MESTEDTIIDQPRSSSFMKQYNMNTSISDSQKSQSPSTRQPIGLMRVNSLE